MSLISPSGPTQRLLTFLSQRLTVDGSRRAVPVQEAQHALAMDEAEVRRAVAELESAGWVEVIPSSDVQPLRVQLVQKLA